jgi:dUTP pyrophosphatase
MSKRPYTQPKRRRGFEILAGYEKKATMPVRQTAKSAGYDLSSAETVEIRPNEVVLVPTGLTAYMQNDEFLDIRIRSGTALKRGLILANGGGVVDADYYGNHIQVMLRNVSDKLVIIEKGERIAQAIFKKYLKVDDDNATGERKGGFGHTGDK